MEKTIFVIQNIEVSGQYWEKRNSRFYNYFSLATYFTSKEDAEKELHKTGSKGYIRELTFEEIERIKN